MDNALPIILVICGAALAVAVGAILIVFIVRRRRETTTGQAQPGFSATPPVAPPMHTDPPTWAPSSSSGATTGVPGAGAGSQECWSLLVVDGADVGRRHPLRNTSRVGRNPGLEVVVDDPQVSRHHAVIECSETRAIISDAGSSNGTFLNGARIQDATPLRHGDTFRVGNTLLRVEYIPAAPSVAAPDFCGRCGAILAPGYASCPACGATTDVPGPTPAHTPPAIPVSPPPECTPAPFPMEAHAPAYDTEPIIGVITGLTRRKGLFGVQAYNLVLTDRRLVFDRITNAMMKEAVHEARTEAKAEGKGFFGKIGAQMGYMNRFVARYHTMPVDAILRLHAENFSVAADQVRKVSFRTGDPGQNQPDRMVVHSAEKHRFDLAGISAGRARATLRQVLGKRVR